MITNNNKNVSQTDVVTFIRCSQKTYDNITIMDSNAVYFVLDTGRIYLGNNLVGEVNVGPQWEDPDSPIDTAVIGTAKLGLLKLGS